MDSCKYIVYDDILAGLTIVVFPATLTHANVAEALGACDRVKSAGFLKVEDSEVHCYGESISLKKKSDIERDEHLATRMLFGYK